MFPSPPSDEGLLGGEEVVRDEILGAVAKGGSHYVAAIAARLEFGVARVGRRILGLCGLGVRALSCA